MARHRRDNNNTIVTCRQRPRKFRHHPVHLVGRRAELDRRRKDGTPAQNVRRAAGTHENTGRRRSVPRVFRVDKKSGGYDRFGGRQEADDDRDRGRDRRIFTRPDVAPGQAAVLRRKIDVFDDKAIARPRQSHQVKKWFIKFIIFINRRRVGNIAISEI